MGAIFKTARSLALDAKILDKFGTTRKIGDDLYGPSPTKPDKPVRYYGNLGTTKKTTGGASGSLLGGG